MLNLAAVAIVGFIESGDANRNNDIKVPTLTIRLIWMDLAWVTTTNSNRTMVRLTWLGTPGRASRPVKPPVN